MINDATEGIVQGVPVRVRMRVKWGDCDPAGVVYTVRFGDYVSCAYDLFQRHLLDGPPWKVREELGFDMPAKALTFEFLASLRPDDEFEMTVRVADIRNRTFDIDIEACNLAGRVLFRAKLTPITIRFGDRSAAIQLPVLLRERLEHYRNQCNKSDPV
jgi:acyl-CoA thioesterase FadM